MINNDNGTLNNELYLYVILNAHSFMGMMLYVWLHFGKPSCRNHNLLEASILQKQSFPPHNSHPQSAAAAWIFLTLHPVWHMEARRLMKFTILSVLVLLQTQAEKMRSGVLWMLCSWGLRFQLIHMLVFREPETFTAGVCLWGREELSAALWRHQQISSHSQKASVPEAWRGLPGRVWYAAAQVCGISGCDETSGLAKPIYMYISQDQNVVLCRNKVNICF